MNLWLIRHPNLKFERPISQAELIEMIESGKLNPMDEVCVSGGYWFQLQESQEVRKFLGDIQLQGMMPNLSDRTSTSLNTLDPKLSIFEPIRQEPLPTPKVRITISAPNGSKPIRYRQDELDAPASFGARVFFIFILVFIFFGTLYLLWAGSR
jgi:hypothetical protein